MGALCCHKILVPESSDPRKWAWAQLAANMSPARQHRHQETRADLSCCNGDDFRYKLLTLHWAQISRHLCRCFCWYYLIASGLHSTGFNKKFNFLSPLRNLYLHQDKCNIEIPFEPISVLLGKSWLRSASSADISCLWSQNFQNNSNFPIRRSKVLWIHLGVLNNPRHIKINNFKLNNNILTQV